MAMKEIISNNRKTIAIVILVIIGLASFFLIGSFASSEDSFTGTYEALDNKRTTVMELMGVTAASSTAISLLPGDAGTPIAEQMADLSGYFMFIIAAICMEKWLLTITGALAFKLLIPISCALGIVAIVVRNRFCAAFGLRLFLVALMMFAIIPVSGLVSERIDASYEATVKQTIEDSKRDAKDIRDTVGDEEDDNVVEKLFNKVKGGVKGKLEDFENTLSRLTEAIAVLIVTSCAIPIAVMAFFIWMIRMLTGANLKLPNIRASRIIGRK